MLKSRVNLKSELLAQRARSKPEHQIMDEVRRILIDNEHDRSAIRSRLAGNEVTRTNVLHFDFLEPDCIFHIDQIRKVCVDYRLRFLDSAFFKNEIPEEAISKIRHLEKLHNTTLSGFKIAAPSKAFHLMNYDDPLLFVALGNDYFYLVHKWGKDMHVHRKWLVLPVKNLWNFCVFCIVASLVTAMLVPENRLSQSVPMASVIIFLFAFKSILAVAMYGFFMTGRKFNSQMWDSKFYNH